MAYTITPSVGMLPLDDLGTALEKKGFICNISNQDIEKATRKDIVVDGATVTVPGITDASLIAVCTGQINSSNEMDRETIKNAMHLSGRPASEYLAVEDKDALVEQNNNLSKTHSEEIELLRDELYNLKVELIKTGHLEDTDVSKGFIDGFKTKRKKYSVDETNVISVSGDSIKQEKNIFDETDWVGVHKDKNNDESVFVDEVISEVGNDIVLKSGSNDISTSSTLLKKSVGEYKNGTFSFSKTTYNVVSTKERYTVLNDDVEPKEMLLSRKDSGFATVIRIPTRNSGFLTKFVAQGRKIGNPGILTCYVIEGNLETIKNLAANNKLSEIINNETFVAKSLPATLPSKKDKEIIFDFKNSAYDVTNIASTLYPQINGGTEYCFIIEAGEVNDQDLWIIDFGMNRGDLQTNNKSFIFNKRTVDNNALDELETLEDERDMFYTVVTRDVEDEEEIPYRSGLYTVAKPIRLSEPLLASRARATLEVNKEGNFITMGKGLIRENIDSLEFRKHDGTIAEQTIIVGGDKIAIGQTIANAITTTPSSVTIDKNIYLNESVPIYRIGYDVQLKVRLVEEDPETHLPVVKPENERTLKMNLVSVMPTGRELDSSASDRLIFETENLALNSLPAFNEAELQIKWRGNVSSEGMRIQLQKGNDYVGRIRNLSLSFDKTI